MQPVQPEQEVVPAVDAATVAVLRDGEGGLEALLLRRVDTAGFVPGAHVFPGGVVDPGDSRGHDLVDGIDDARASRQVGVSSDGLRFWMAAVRECLEEAAVSPGVLGGTGNGSPRSAPSALPALRTPPVDLGPLRRQVHAGEVTFPQALAASGARLDASALRCISRWVTPVWSPRRFDTRFFIAALPDGAEVSHDGTETSAHEWIRPADALAAGETGRITMIMPTTRTMAALARHSSVADAMENLDFGDPAEPLLPEMHEEPDGRRVAVLPSDPEGNGGVYDADSGEPLERSGAG